MILINFRRSCQESQSAKSCSLPQVRNQGYGPFFRGYGEKLLHNIVTDFNFRLEDFKSPF